MQLLIFAHRGEAQVFITEMKAKANLSFSDLYDSDSCLILICGEGIQNASIRTAAVLSKHQDKIHSVINIGVAGALDRSLEIKTIVQIRTVYAEQRSKKVEFKSYSSLSKSKLDCISSVDRIMDDQQSNYLSHFAQVVDRELWGIANACQVLNKSFRAYKLISDYAGSNTSCFDIKHQAIQFSQQLYDYFLEHNSNPVTVKKELLHLPDGFYSTVTQQRHIQSLTERLAIKLNSMISNVLTKNLLNKMLEIDTSPKKRTARLIQELNNQLNPFRHQLDKSLNTVLEPLKHSGISVAIDENYERTEFKIQTTIHNEKQLERTKQGLNNFDYNKFIQLLKGRDVR